ncbi:AAA family ATPase [Paraburkholderia sp. EG287A]|uniref:AAA family ATPase n=1 Tax=Paraburkholderia sp. EG287A TaxID=3237012 RepID=UPI0034D2A7CD
MANKTKPARLSARARRLVRAALFVAVGVLGSAGAYWNQQVQTAERTKTEAALVTEAHKGAYKLSDTHMREHAEWWLHHQLSVSELTQMMDSDKVSAVGIADANASPTSHPVLLVTSRDGQLGFVPDTRDGALAEKLILTRLNKAHVIRVAETSPGAALMAGLLYFLVNYLFVFVMFYMMARPFLEQMRLFKTVRNVKTRFSDVIGANEAKMALQDVVDFIKSPAHYERIGARASRGVLLIGAPGTGKTLLARALAGEAGVPFIACTGSDFASMWLGGSVLNVKRLFRLARRKKKCIIYIDEFDGIGKRSANTSGADGELNRLINQFLVEMNGFSTDHRIVVIAGSNLIENIDPALARSGRFDRKITLNLPSLDEREQLFKLYGDKLELAGEVKYAQLARMTFGLSPADIEALVNQAGIRAARERKNAVTMDHMVAAIEVAYLGEASGLTLTEGERRRTALHEAGHAAMTVLRKAGRLEKVTVLPRDRSLGVTLSTHDEKTYLSTKQQLLDRIDVLLAGRATEGLFYPSVSTGAEDDLKKATELATAMIARFGFGIGLAVLTREQQADQRFVSELNGLLAHRYEQVIRELDGLRPVLETIAGRLEEQDTISGSLVEELLEPQPAAA